MYLNEGKEHTIFTIDALTNRITLDDNSKWEVADIDTYRLPLWLVTNKVIVKKSGLDYQMTKIDSNETIKVKEV